MSLVRQKYIKEGLSTDVVDFLVLAWRVGTRRQYECYLKKWVHNCNVDNVNPLEPGINYVLKFLLQGYRQGLSYSTLGTIRSALSAIITIDGKPVGQHYLVVLFMRAVFQQRPALTKTLTWEVNDVFIYLKSLSPLDSLSLEQLTKKTLMLMSILSGQRGQTLHALRKEHLKPLGNDLVFHIKTLLKTSKPGRHFSQIIFKSYPHDSDVCVVACIKAYLKYTECFRLNKKSSQFFITYGSPNCEASRASISRWLKDVLRDAGIDADLFGSHSTRSASTSAAKSVCNLDTVLRAGGWACASTFTKHYDLKVTPKCDMQDALLQRFQNMN